MTDALKAFMQANALTAPAFEPGSRYHGIDTAQWMRPDGALLVYARRRFIPPPEQFATLHEYRVQSGDRVDNLANKVLGDPQQYWQLCDGNGAMRPDDLTDTVGPRLRITLPAGVPGVGDG